MRVFVVVVLSFFSACSYACSCREIDVEKVYAESISVFTARITGQKIIRDGEAVSSEFSVLETLKGYPGEVKRIISSTTSSTCWKPLLTGEIYLFYANGSEINYSRCSPHKHVGPGNLGE